jgi:hypothetical protein
MKRLIALALIIILFGATSRTIALAPKSTSVNYVPDSFSPASVIDGIEVPFDVEAYVQLQYQGCAVIQAKKIIYHDQSAFRLLIDHDSMPYGSNSFYLLYDMNWKLLGEQKIIRHPKLKIEPSPTNDSESNIQQPLSAQPQVTNTGETAPITGQEGSTTQTGGESTNSGSTTTPQTSTGQTTTSTP